MSLFLLRLLFPWMKGRTWAARYALALSVLWSTVGCPSSEDTAASESERGISSGDRSKKHAAEDDPNRDRSTTKGEAPSPIATDGERRASDKETRGGEKTAIRDNVRREGGTATPLAMLGAGTSTHDSIREHLRNEPPELVRAVGSTSLVFYLRLRGEHNAAYKPRAEPRLRGYRAEIAAYQLARMLAMDNVPPVVTRYFPENALETKISRRDAAFWPEFRRLIRWEDDGTVSGAMIYWVPEMSSLKLERGPWWERWHRWLKQGEPLPEKYRSLAADLSTMIAFDYVIANWDRFSGGNTHTNENRTRLFIRDHDSAFYTPLPTKLRVRIWRHLRSTQKFSRSWVRRLVELSPKEVRAKLRQADERTPLLRNDEIDAVLDRRQTVLSYIGSLIEAHGEKNVLVFP